MGKLEDRAKKRAKRIDIEARLLAALYIAVTTGVMVTAPNLLQLLKHADPNWISKRDPRRRLRETLSRMKRKGLVDYKQQGGKNVHHLTAYGKRVAQRITLGTMEITKPLRWDRRWRLIIFDISEKRKPLRERVRHIVERLGFHRLQDSVWVHPYNCEDIIALLKLDLRIGREVIYIIADAIEFDKPLRAHFHLPSD